MFSIDRRPGRLWLRFLWTAIFITGLPSFSSAAQRHAPCDLYSWEKDHEWYYALMTGHDRSREAVDIRWSVERVKGIYSLKRKILNLPAGTQVHWLEMGDQGLVLPPQEVVSDLTMYAASVGVDVDVHPSSPSSKPHPEKD